MIGVSPLAELPAGLAPTQNHPARCGDRNERSTRSPDCLAVETALEPTPPSQQRGLGEALGRVMLPVTAALLRRRASPL